MIERTFAFLAAAAALGLSPAAHATELLFSVNYDANGPGLIETFEVNTAEPGTLSAASAAYYGTAQDIDFSITDDSLGNTVLQIGGAGDTYFFSTATGDSAAFYNDAGEYTYVTSTSFYDGVDSFLEAYSGELAVGVVDGTLTTISVQGVPEPATWIMILMGVGSLGAALRGRRRLAVSAI